MRKGVAKHVVSCIVVYSDFQIKWEKDEVGNDEDEAAVCREDSSSESGSGNGLPALTPPSSTVTDGTIVRETEVINGNGGPAPLDFSTPTSSSSSSEDQQPMNLSDPPPQRLPLSSSHLPVTVSAAAAALLGALHPSAPEELRRKYPLAAKPPLAPHPALPLPLPHTHNAHTPNTHSQSHTHTAELRLDRDGRDYGGKMFVRLFVDENLDRMVPISKQPKEKIQAIIESCSRQFPEFQERARKRIRTYLKSCRRMKKSGMETRPTPPHLTSAMAENILAAACESESRNAAKRMRLDAYHDEQISLDKPSGGGGGLREPASLAHSAYSLAASAFSSQDSQLYINGAGLSYGYRGFPGLGTAMQHPVSLTTAAAAQSNGPTDLSMKSVSSASISNSTSSASTNNSLGGRGSGGGGGGGASTQLSQPEITAVRQLIAGYRESAAFLLRSADELENLILQQN
ncbi:Nucleolar protein 4-like [Liparis tanakae]|uniref:Nucleolar protein 4-like n=1 Tax=Liparis tanakae TaxID=230148 RepID=A0A4Z2JCN4_9TELE|nr:Nucleolar protein 4-like [Liparis tanakae]